MPDQKLVVFPTEHDCFFGILHSRFHEIWSLATCSWIGAGNDPTYTTSTVFETFPFPEGLEPNRNHEQISNNPFAEAIASVARKLNDLRETWLNPPSCIKKIPEVVQGYPDRLVAVDSTAEKTLSKRTLTNLYNEMPTWLQNAHKELDDAVADAYGWSTGLTDDEVLEKLFALNQHCSKEGLIC